MNFDPQKHLVFEGIVGSRLYGTDTPESDLDIRGVCAPPMEVLLDPFTGFDQKDSGFEEEDKVIYALGKFFKLCADNNPNIVELLFVPKEYTTTTSSVWEKILENKNLFLSKKSRHTFSGYAVSQLHKMQRHREWFLNPPKEKPTREMFGLPNTPLVSGDGLNALSNISPSLYAPEYADEIKREIKYKDAKRRWDNYATWQKERNPKRKGFEEGFGYDTKSASHLMRLIWEGRELLLTGNIKFPLDYADEVRAIKNGKYTYEEIIEMASGADKSFNEWGKESILPFGSNKDKLKELYLEIIQRK